MQEYLHDLFALPDERFSLTDSLIQWFKSIFDYDTINTAFSSIVSLTLSAVIAFFSISFITFFFLKDDELFLSMLKAPFPERVHGNIERAMSSVSQLLMRYFTGILSESCILMIVISVTMIFFGMRTQDAFFIGLIMGVMNVVPYAGPLIGGVMSVFMGEVTPIEGMTTGHTMFVIAGSLLIIKGFDDFVLQPTLYSERVKAHPLEIFIVILIAGSLAGIVGMLLAIPSYTVLRVFAKEFFSQFRPGTETHGENLNRMIIEGIVVHGNSLGGRMGFPTANIEADAALDARDGVYASRVEVDGRMYDAMSNLGYKPTVDGRRRLLETNIFGFEGDLYGRRLRVELLRFIRPERRFGSVEELFRQIGDDRREVCGGRGRTA